MLLLATYGLTITADAARFASSAWVAFGDSLTVGIGASSPQTSFIGILEKSVGPIDNQAVSATRITDQLLAIDAYAGSATHVIWLLGYNDMRAGTPLDQFQTDLRSALDYFDARHMTVYIGLCLHMTSAGYAAYGPIWNHGSDAAVEAINEVIRMTAQSYPNVYLVDMALYDPNSGASNDLVHPNDSGHLQIALAYEQYLPHLIYLPLVIFARSY